jgi:hypothetical protein
MPCSGGIRRVRRLLHEHGADEADGVAAWEDADDVGRTAEFLVEPEPLF